MCCNVQFRASGFEHVLDIYLSSTSAIHSLVDVGFRGLAFRAEAKIGRRYQLCYVGLNVGFLDGDIRGLILVFGILLGIVFLKQVLVIVRVIADNTPLHYALASGTSNKSGSSCIMHLPNKTEIDTSKSWEPLISADTPLAFIYASILDFALPVP